MSAKGFKLLPLLLCLSFFSCEQDLEDIYDETDNRAYKSEIYGDIDLINEDGSKVQIDDESLSVDYNIELDLTIVNTKTQEKTQVTRELKNTITTKNDGSFYLYLNLVFAPDERITSLKLKSLNLVTTKGSKLYSKSIFIGSSLWEQATDYTQAYFELGVEEEDRAILVGNSQYLRLRFNKSLVLTEQ